MRTLPEEITVQSLRVWIRRLWPQPEIIFVSAEEQAQIKSLIDVSFIVETTKKGRGELDNVIRKRLHRHGFVYEKMPFQDWIMFDGILILFDQYPEDR